MTRTTTPASPDAPESVDMLIGERRRNRILVVGEALIDVVQQVDGTVREHCGGSPANVAITVGRLGYPVELLTWLGADAYAEIVRGWLADSGVDVPLGLGAAPMTPIASAVLDHEGNATYTFELTWDLPDGATVPDDVVAVHTGSLATVLAPGADKVLSLLRSAEHATKFFDPNVRPTLIDDAEDTRRRIEEFVDVADVVRVSDVDLLWIYPYEDPIDVARRIVRDRHPTLVVVTQGPQGATALTARGEVHVPTAATKIVDRVGAGDAATGALIDGLWQAGLLGSDRLQQLAEIDLQTLHAILQWCADLCAYTLAHAGANPPRRSKITTRLELPAR